MTRDHRLHDEQAPDADIDAYTALWAVASFPRLPDDAPEEFKKSAIEIDDPRRVYNIHQAARRHQFHILVERLVLTFNRESHQVLVAC